MRYFAGAEKAWAHQVTHVTWFDNTPPCCCAFISMIRSLYPRFSQRSRDVDDMNFIYNKIAMSFIYNLIKWTVVQGMKTLETRSRHDQHHKMTAHNNHQHDSDGDDTLWLACFKA